MANRPIPSPEILRQILQYDPDTGKLFWKERSAETLYDEYILSEDHTKSWNSRYAGREAFTANIRGYRQGRLLDSFYYAHRVVWAIFYGYWPDAQIDHINGVRYDNRICNLRIVSKQDNAKNSKRRSDNRTGTPGIYWSKTRRHWYAQIKVSGKTIYIGSFVRKAEAIAARKKAEIEHGFHENHGR